MDKENAMNAMFNNVDKSVKQTKESKSKKGGVQKQQKPNKDTAKQTKPSESRDYKKYQKEAQSQYRNIRTNNYTVDALQGFQTVLGSHNRSDVLEKMIECCKPIFLNTKTKRDKFNKMIKAIRMERSLKN